MLVWVVCDVGVGGVMLVWVVFDVGVGGVRCWCGWCLMLVWVV